MRSASRPSRRPPRRTWWCGSWTLSAPATMPAINDINLPAGFVAPDRTRSHTTRSSSTSGRPVCSANAITGTSPARDTRFASSSTASHGTISPKVSFRSAPIMVLSKPIIAGQRALSSSHAPTTNPVRPRIQASAADAARIRYEAFPQGVNGVAGSGSASSTWGPLRIGLFRSLWIAALVSNVGTWMQTVGAQWLLVDDAHAGR